MTLGDLAVWLKSAENRGKWEVSMAAYLTLVSEGHAKIMAGMIADREKALRVALRLMGAPPCSSVVVPLSMVPKATDAWRPDPAYLTTIRTPQGDQVGMLVPEHLTLKKSPLHLNKPCLPKWPSLFHSRSLVHSTDAEDQERLHVIFVDGQEQGSMPPIFQGPKDAKPSPKANKLEAKLVGALAAPRAWAQAFATSESWETIKEAPMQASSNKLHSIRDEAVAMGMQALIQQTENWLEGLLTVKQFLRAYKGWSKSSFCGLKVLDLGDCLRKLLPFLTQVAAVQPAPRLELLLLKVQFTEQAGACRCRVRS
jgi:hypothetical protein